MTATRPLRIVLCDDHEMLLEGLEAALNAHGLQVEATTTNPQEAVRLVLELRPDVCIMDVSFPDWDGVDVASELVKAAPETKVLLLSAGLTADVVRRGVEVGVGGFVSKAGSIAQILRGVERLLSGQVVVEADLLREVIATRTGTWSGGAPDPLARLTSREREVLDCIVDGDDTATIAQRLRISPSTARAHVQNVLMKLGVHTRLQAVAITTGRRGADRQTTSAGPTRRPQ
jgi:two-component system nitrate/nitrite response regulator NarL